MAQETPEDGIRSRVLSVFDWLSEEQQKKTGKPLRQKDFAYLIGVDYQTVGTWIKGTVYPKAHHLADLARRTGVSPLWLLLGEGPRYTETVDVAREVRLAEMAAVRAIERRLMAAIADALRPIESDADQRLLDHRDLDEEESEGRAEKSGAPSQPDAPPQSPAVPRRRGRGKPDGTA